MSLFSWHNFSFHVDYRKCMSNHLIYLVYNWHSLTSPAKSSFLSNSHLSESQTSQSFKLKKKKNPIIIIKGASALILLLYHFFPNGVSRVSCTRLASDSHPLSFPPTSAWCSVSSSLARVLDILPTCSQPTSIFCHRCQFFSLYSTSL